MLNRVAVNKYGDPGLNYAAFFGDLFAVGIIPASEFCKLVQAVMENMKTPEHCRAVYVALLHSSARIGENLPHDWLCDRSKAILILRAHCLLANTNDSREDWLSVCSFFRVLPSTHSSEHTFTSRKYVSLFQNLSMTKDIPL